MVRLTSSPAIACLVLREPNFIEHGFDLVIVFTSRNLPDMVKRLMVGTAWVVS